MEGADGLEKDQVGLPLEGVGSLGIGSGEQDVGVGETFVGAHLRENFFPRKAREVKVEEDDRRDDLFQTGEGGGAIGGDFRIKVGGPQRDGKNIA